MSKKIRAIGGILVVAVWGLFVGFAWFGGSKDYSDAERRKLEQFPEVTWESILNGDFMADFESYTLDQFPKRDSFRQLKALFNYNVLQNLDNNGIYLENGYAAKLEYPLDEDSVNHGMDVVNTIYEKYLKDSGSTVFAAVIPDKGYYLAEANGYPAMDYEKMFALVQERMPFATHIDLTDCLSVEDYYRTDTHWRQEKLIPVAQKISNALGVTAPQAEDFRVTAVDRPFYGVYYGQAALPLPAETMYVMESELLSECKVLNYETNQYMQVYDPAMLESKDLYELYLAGPRSLLTIENPNATTDREPVVETTEKAEVAGDPADKLQRYQEVVRKVWNGEYNHYGDNPGRFVLLEADGYNAEAVQYLVNKGFSYTLTQEDIEAAEAAAGIAEPIVPTEPSVPSEPAENKGKELIIFRDSFGSSIAPLLVQDYKTVTLVDVRYLNSHLLSRYIDFHGQDVLFLYSTLVLNSDTQRMQ